MNNNSGIYCIDNIVNKKFYIGSSENFTFSHLEYCEISELLIREQAYFDTFLFAQEYIRKENKWFLQLGFNICPIAGRSTFSEHSEETKKRLSIISINLWKDPVFRAKQMLSYTDERMRSTVEKRTISMSLKWEEYVETIRESVRKRMNDPVLYKKWYDKTWSKEASESRSVKMLKKWKDPLYRNKILLPQTFEKRSSVRVKAWADPEIRKRFLKGISDPEVCIRREKSRMKAISDPNYVNTAWKPIVAIDRTTNKVVHEFPIKKKASQWASNELKTDARVEWYIKNSHKDYIGLKWMYKSDYVANY